MLPNLTLIYDRKCQSGRNVPAVIELRITAGGQRKYISTGVKVLPKEWSNGSVVGRKDWKELNDQIQMVKKKCSEVIMRMIDEGSFDINAVPNMLKAEIQQQMTFTEYARMMAEKRYNKITEGTRKHYEVTLKFLERWKGLLHFSDVTERNITLMDDVLAKKGLKESSRWNYHKIVKTIIIRAMEDDLLKRNPYDRLDIKRGNEEGLTRYLTPAEFHSFEVADIPIERLRKVRDLFVFQTYTMMGYSDLAAFDYSCCQRIDGQYVYKSKRQKTKQDFTIVIVHPALEILKRYCNRLPIISNVKYNEYLKAAAVYAGIDKQISTHWARHTGATMYLNEGKVPMHIIQHMLGHASIRETEKTYAKLMDETIVETMANYQSMRFPVKKR